VRATINYFHPLADEHEHCCRGNSIRPPLKFSEIGEEVRIPFDKFAPYGGFLRQTFDVVKRYRSLAVAAFVAWDHNADPICPGGRFLMIC